MTPPPAAPPRPQAGGDALRGGPTYEDWQGTLYNHDGEVVKAPPKLEQWRTDELLPLRCPHPPTACKMATLIRQVRAAPPRPRAPRRPGRARRRPRAVSPGAATSPAPRVRVRVARARTRAAALWVLLARQVKSESDSIGGTVACVARKVPAGLGEPVFDRLEAKLAHAMLSLPATKVSPRPICPRSRPISPLR